MIRYKPSLRVLVALVLTASLPLRAQTCNPAISSSTPTAGFTLNANGTVTHLRTGLTWMRCSLGQVWNGDNCSGTANSYTWQQALQAPQGFIFAGSGDWRLPNKNELASVVERSCSDPAIDLTVFPATPDFWFWSSSPYAGFSSAAWSVNFDFGYVAPSHDRSEALFVRLVRGGQ